MFLIPLIFVISLSFIYFYSKFFFNISVIFFIIFFVFQNINIYPYKINNFTHVISESKEIHCILVDEAQFLSESNVEELRKLTNEIPVICYGLRTDYRSQLFPGSKRLLELADTIEEIKTICIQCKNKAIINCKFSTENNRQIFIKSGSDKPDIGAEDKYKPLCWKCWH